METVPYEFFKPRPERDIAVKLVDEMTPKTLRSSSKCTTAQMLAANILATVNDFASGAEQSDDITMLCVKHKMDDINSTTEETTDTAMPARKED